MKISQSTRVFALIPLYINIMEDLFYPTAPFLLISASHFSNIVFSFFFIYVVPNLLFCSRFNALLPLHISLYHISFSYIFREFPLCVHHSCWHGDFDKTAFYLLMPVLSVFDLNFLRFYCVDFLALLPCVSVSDRFFEVLTLMLWLDSFCAGFQRKQTQNKFKNLYSESIIYQSIKCLNILKFKM